jgi:hypothetical protein
MLLQKLVDLKKVVKMRMMIAMTMKMRSKEMIVKP